MLNFMPVVLLGDNHIQIFIWGGISSDIWSEIEFYDDVSRAVKRNFPLYIRRYASSNELFKYGYPHSNALLQFHLKLESCKQCKTSCHPMKCDVIDYGI